MRVNVTPRWTHTHRDLGIRIIYRRIIRRIACVRVWGSLRFVLMMIIVILWCNHNDRSLVQSTCYHQESCNAAEIIACNPSILRALPVEGYSERSPSGGPWK
jgi:hypothetical protein